MLVRISGLDFEGFAGHRFAERYAVARLSAITFNFAGHDRLSTGRVLSWCAFTHWISGVQCGNCFQSRVTCSNILWSWGYFQCFSFPKSSFDNWWPAAELSIHLVRVRSWSCWFGVYSFLGDKRHTRNSRLTAYPACFGRREFDVEVSPSTGPANSQIVFVAWGYYYCNDPCNPLRRPPSIAIWRFCSILRALSILWIACLPCRTRFCRFTPGKKPLSCRRKTLDIGANTIWGYRLSEEFFEISCTGL